MSGYGSAGAHYLRDTVQTATPAARLVMLYDRLVIDLVRAESALESTPVDFETANSTLKHAQEILSLLDATLDVDAWSGAGNLRALYQWALGQLLQANLAKDASLVRSARATVEPLRDAWRSAAVAVASAARPEAVSYVA